MDLNIRKIWKIKIGIKYLYRGGLGLLRHFLINNFYTFFCCCCFPQLFQNEFCIFFNPFAYCEKVKKLWGNNNYLKKINPKKSTLLKLSKSVAQDEICGNTLFEMLFTMLRHIKLRYDPVIYDEKFTNQ